MGLNALTVSSSGVVYGAGGNRVYTINTTTGAATALAGNVGGNASAGDMVFDDLGNLYLTAGNGNLVRVDPTTGGLLSTVNTGNTAIFGLAFDAGRLIGFSGSSVFTINPATGATTALVPGTTGIGSPVFGAASAPIPEPATLAVFGGLALAGLSGYRRRKAKVTA